MEIAIWLVSTSDKSSKLVMWILNAWYDKATKHSPWATSTPMLTSLRGTPQYMKLSTNHIACMEWTTPPLTHLVEEQRDFSPWQGSYECWWHRRTLSFRLMQRHIDISAVCNKGRSSGLHSRDWITSSGRMPSHWECFMQPISISWWCGKMPCYCQVLSNSGPATRSMGYLNGQLMVILTNAAYVKLHSCNTRNNASWNEITHLWNMEQLIPSWLIQ